jgi:hypothetical protein
VGLEGFLQQIFQGNKFSSFEYSPIANIVEEGVTFAAGEKIKFLLSSKELRVLDSEEKKDLNIRNVRWVYSILDGLKDRLNVQEGYIGVTLTLYSGQIILYQKTKEELEIMAKELGLSR